MQLTPRTTEMNETDAQVMATSNAVEAWRADAGVSYVAREALDFPELLEILLRRWRWIVGTLTLTLAIGLLMTALQQRKYAATTEIVIYQQAQQRDDGGLTAVNKIEGMATNRSIRTQLRLLQSHDTLQRALAYLPVDVRTTGFPNGPELQVKAPDEGDDVIAVTVKALTPQAATALANNLAQVLIERDVEESRKTSTTALAYVGSELNHVDNSLQMARRQLAEFEIAHGVVGENKVITPHMQSLSQLQLEAEQAARAATAAQQLAQTLRANLNRKNRDVLTARTEAQHPILNKVEMQINDLETRRLELLQKYVPTAPEVTRVEGELRAAREQRDQFLSKQKSQSAQSINPFYQQQYLAAMTDADTARTRLAVLQREIAAKRESLAQLPGLEMRAAELKNRVTLLEAESALLSTNYQSLRVNEASQISNVRVLNRAYENPVPVSPDTRRNLVLSLVLGILLAVIVTMSLEAVDRRSYTQR